MSDRVRSFVRLVQGLFAAGLLFVGANYLQNPLLVANDMPTLGRLHDWEKAKVKAAYEAEQKENQVEGAELPNPRVFNVSDMPIYRMTLRGIALAFVALGIFALMLGPTTFLWMLRICLALLFIYSGLQKIVKPDLFAKNIACYLMLPSQWVNPASFVLPVLEVLAGLALLLPWTKNAGAVLIALMLLMFIGMTSYALYLGLDLDCGCGAAPHPLEWDKPVKNFIYLLGCCAICCPREEE